jgi:hypothetical protein
MCLVFRSDCVKTVWTCSWARPARARLSCLKLCLDHALKISNLALARAITSISISR